jgi:hypothetical protein
LIVDKLSGLSDTASELSGLAGITKGWVGLLTLTVIVVLPEIWPGD